MTVKELKQILEGVDDKLEVVCISYAEINSDLDEAWDTISAVTYEGSLILIGDVFQPEQAPVKLYPLPTVKK